MFEQFEKSRAGCARIIGIIRGQNRAFRALATSEMRTATTTINDQVVLVQIALRLEHARKVLSQLNLEEGICGGAQPTLSAAVAAGSLRARQRSVLLFSAHLWTISGNQLICAAVTLTLIKLPLSKRA